VATTKKEIRTDYLAMLLEPRTFKKLASAATKRLKPLSNTFEAVAFRGMSGSIFGSVVATRLNKPIVLVRKGENRHSAYSVEGVEPATYIIVDDMIASGATIDAIVSEMKNFHPQAKCVGIYLYHDTDHNKRITKKYNCWMMATRDGKD
jgi:adenine/guanine phosphoribosyltransferase-like PRPP-binding protein